MTAAEWDYLAVKLQAYWPSKAIPDESLDLWFADLGEFEAEQVEAAIIALYRDGREWAPNGAQIRNKLLELRTDEPDHGKAYELAMQAAGPMGGFERGMEWLREQSPLAAEAAETYGWRDFCLNGDIDEGTRRAQYRDIYRTLASRSERDQRYAGIAAAGLEGLPEGPKRIGDVVRELPKETA